MDLTLIFRVFDNGRLHFINKFIEKRLRIQWVSVKDQNNEMILEFLKFIFSTLSSVIVCHPILTDLIFVNTGKRKNKNVSQSIVLRSWNDVGPFRQFNNSLVKIRYKIIKQKIPVGKSSRCLSETMNTRYAYKHVRLKKRKIDRKC